MKIIIVIAILAICLTNLKAQVDSTINRENKDTTRIVLGKKEIQIIDNEEGTDIQVRKKNNDGSNEPVKPSKHSGWHSGGFKGHWAGIEFGLNNYLTKGGSFSLPQSMDYMSLRTSRSINFNLNFFQHSFGIIGNQVGFVTGMGFEFLNYFFQNNNSIERGNVNGENVIVPRPYDPIDLEKSKLSMTYLTVPLILEIQFPGSLSHNHRLRIAGGVIGGLKLRSHTKVVFTENGDRIKNKNWDDFYINSFRYGFTGRIGYRHVNIFCNYYPVSLFQKDKGPELYPISMGLSLVGL